jgi:stage V sporulation protein G
MANADNKTMTGTDAKAITEAEAAAEVKLEVRAFPIENPKNSIVAFASANIAEVFAVNNIKVINSEKGLFVAMPQVKDGKGEFRDICFPITREFRQKLNDAILGEYAAACERKATEKESTVEKLREAGRDAKKSIATAKTTKEKSGPEL